MTKCMMYVLFTQIKHKSRNEIVTIDLLGRGGVGKTSILYRYYGGKFITYPDCGIEDYYRKFITIKK